MTQILAHRGASRAARENTVDAFRLAVEMGADGIELDVRRCGDGTLVVHHDPVLNDGRAIDQLRVDRLPGWVPTLEDALVACGAVAVNVEIKFDDSRADAAESDELVDETMEVLGGIDGGQPSRRWLISSFRIGIVERVVDRFPTVRSALLAEELCPQSIRRAIETGCGGINPNDQSVTKAALDAAHRAGLQVGVWTVDDPVRIAELIGWGVDAIFTNVPDVAIGCRELAQTPGVTTTGNTSRTASGT